MPKALKTLDDLRAHDLIGAEDKAALQDVAQTYAISITPDALAAIQMPSNDPVAIQYVPDTRELVTTPDEISDPIGDQVHEVTKGLIHRYPDRVLFKVTSTCAVYCRFCFRREMVGQGKDALKDADITTAIDYIASHAQIHEVILSGGDPLILSPRRLQHILQQLEHIAHIATVRIHTRLPIAAPSHLTEDMCIALKTNKKLVIVLHVNHAQELTDSVREATSLLHQTGAMLLSQSVLLKGVNNDPDILAALFRKLIAMNIKPYYLHHPDKAPGTSHFRIGIAEGRTIYRRLQGHLSGPCLPQYVLDIPGGFGKVPLNADWIEPHPEGGYTVKDYQGRTHRYHD